METKTSRIGSLRKALKNHYLKNNDNRVNANAVDRLPARAVVRIFKIVFGSHAYAAIKEAN